MNTDPRASLFYGYVEPLYYVDPSWSKIAYKKIYGCYGGIYGAKSDIRHFLAVEESLHNAGWNVVTLNPQGLVVKPKWNEQLRLASEHFGIDVTGLVPNWHLVSLHF